MYIDQTLATQSTCYLKKDHTKQPINFFLKTYLLVITFLLLRVSTILYIFVSFNDCNSDTNALSYLGASSLIASLRVIALKEGAKA
jgi:hypothetical protein